jgi:integrase
MLMRLPACPLAVLRRSQGPGISGLNPVPRGLLTRRHGGSVRSRTVPLVRVPCTLPRILPPQEADRLVAALRTHRDRAMVLAMLLAGLRRSEVLGLRFEDHLFLSGPKKVCAEHCYLPA